MAEAKTCTPHSPNPPKHCHRNIFTLRFHALRAPKHLTPILTATAFLHFLPCSFHSNTVHRLSTRRASFLRTVLKLDLVAISWNARLHGEAYCQSHAVRALPRIPGKARLKLGVPSRWDGRPADFESIISFVKDSLE